MESKYVGDLPKKDPLYHFLKHDVLPQLTHHVAHASFRVFKMHSSNNDVYLYEDKETHTRVIGKFFIGDTAKKHEDAARRAHQEFANLNLLRSYGLQRDPHHVVKPLAYNLDLNNVLVEEYCQGDSLTAIIHNAIHHHKRHALYRKLTSLAYFLATMHNTTAKDMRVDFRGDCEYLCHLLQQVKKKRLINEHEENHFHSLCQRWQEQPRMWEDHQVLAHGDATPSNFLFGHGLNVTAIDLERMKYSDRVLDLGRIVGELQHYFVMGTGNKNEAEGFIGHFLWEYSCHFPDRHKAFNSITGRLPFQIAVTLLRIARNSWIAKDHAHKLVTMAKSTLESL